MAVPTITTGCLEMVGVIGVASVATSSMIVCGTANCVAAVKGRRIPRPKAAERDIPGAPSVRAGPGDVTAYVDGHPLGGVADVGFDGEVLLTAEREGDYHPTITVGGANVHCQGNTIWIHHDHARDVELKFSSEKLALQWKNEFLPCVEKCQPYARIDELRKAVLQQQSQIKGLRQKALRDDAEIHKLKVYRDSYEAMEAETGGLGVNFKIDEHRKQVAELHDTLHKRISFLEDEIPEKHRALQEMHETAHARLANIESGPSSNLQAVNQRLQKELQEALTQKHEIEVFAQQMEKRANEAESKRASPQDGASAFKSRSLQGAATSPYSAAAARVTSDSTMELTSQLRDAETRRLQLEATVVDLQSRLGVAESTAPSGGSTAGTVPEAEYIQLQQTVQAYEAEANQKLQEQDMTIQALVAEKDQFQTEYKQLSAQFETLQREAYREKAARQEIESSLSQPRSPLQDPQVPILKQDLELSQAKVADVENERNQAQSQVYTLQRELQDVRLQCMEQARQLDSQVRQVESLQEADVKLRGLEQLHGGLQDEKRAIDRKVMEHEVSKEMMSKELQAMDQKLRALEEEKRIVEQKARDLEMSNGTMAKEFESELMITQQRHTEEMQRVQTLQADRESHVNRVQLLEQEKASLLNEMDIVSAKNRQLETASAGRTSETSAQIFELQQRAMDSEVRAAGLEAKITAAEDAKATANAQTVKLEELLNIEKQKFLELQQATQELQMATRTKDLETQEMQMAARTKSLEVTELTQAVNSKDRMLDQLQENARIKDQMIQQLQDERNLFESERSAVSNENTNLRAAYDELKLAYESAMQSMNISPPVSPNLNDSRDIQGDQQLISKLTEQNSDLKNQLELTWKKINEQTKRIEEERSAFWEELEQVRVKTNVKISQAPSTSVPSSISKPPAFSTAGTARSNLDRLGQASSQTSASGRTTGAATSKYNIGSSFASRTTGASTRVGVSTATPEMASRLLAPGATSAYGTSTTRPSGLSYAQTAAVSGRPLTGDTVRKYDMTTTATTAARYT